MISLHTTHAPNPYRQLPEFKPAAVEDGRTPLHPGWLPVLGKVPLFASLPKRHLRRVAALAELRRFKHGAEMVRVGAKGNAFFILLDGSAEVTTPAGHRVTLQAGDYFGELALLDGAPRAATVKASTAVAAARIERAAFLSLLKEEPAIWAGLTHGLLSIVRDMQED
jgi:CRP-like cAMP-binding protein